MTDVITPHHHRLLSLLPLHAVKDQRRHIAPANSAFPDPPTERRNAAFVSIGASGVLTPREPLATALSSPGRSRRNKSCACRGTTQNDASHRFGRWWR